MKLVNLIYRNIILINKILFQKNFIYSIFSVSNADIRLFADNFAIINRGRLFYPITVFLSSCPLETILPDNFNYTLIGAAIPSNPRHLKLVNISTLKRIW